MSVYFSTQASVQAKVTALHIQYWLDPDGDDSIDTDALDSGLQAAKNKILAYVEPRYGSSVTDDWDSSTRPDYIGELSDWITLYETLPGGDAEHPVAIRRYNEAIADLEKIRTYELMIPGLTENGQDNETTRMTYLECSDADAEAGLCDPCAYEYI